MAFPVSILLTKAQCQQVLDSLTLERRVFSVQDLVLDLRSDQATDRATARAADISEQQTTVARLTPLVASLTAGTPEYLLNSRLLLRATRRLEDLTGSTAAPTSTADPVDALLKAVDVQQVVVQLPVLDQAIAEVTAHMATLAN